MTAPRILVSAGRLQLGGGVNVLRGLVEEAFPQLPAEFIIICREDVASALNGSRKNVTVVPENSAVQGSLVSAALREQIAVRKLAREHRCDLILGIGSAAILFPPCPQVLVLTNRQYLSEEYWQRVAKLSRVYSLTIRGKGLFLRHSLRRCSLLMTESEAMKSLICRRWRIPPDKVAVLHKGINPLVVSPSRRTVERNTPPVILCVSHFGVHKGFDTLVAAAANLERMGIRFSAWLAGNFEDRRWGDPIQAMAERCFDASLEASGVKQRFRFLGALSAAQVADAYRNADLCVFPSWCESYPNPIPESLANGVPIVAADTDINHELAGDAALYFRPQDPSELAGRIAFLIGSPAARRSLSERAVGRARGFSWRRTTDDLREALRSALGEGKVAATLAICDEFH